MALVPLVLLPDRVSVGASTVRCNVSPNPSGAGTVVETVSFGRVRCSVKLICRPGAGIAVGDSLTVHGVSCTAVKTHTYDTTGPWLNHMVVFAATDSDVYGGALDTTVTVYASVDSVDAYGTTVRVPSVSGVTVSARFDHQSSFESHADGQRRAQAWIMTTAADLSTVDAYSRLVDEDNVVWQLTGDPVTRTHPSGTLWSQVTVRRTGDGAA